MKIQHIVIIAILIAAVSLGLQVASNSKLQFDIKNLNSKTIQQENAIKTLSLNLTEGLQMTDIKSKTAEQEQLIQSLSNELNSTRQLLEKSNMTVTQLQSNSEYMNNEIKLLNQRIDSLEHKIQEQSAAPLASVTTNSIIPPAKTNAAMQIQFPMNSTISMTRPEIKILSITMSPNSLKVGDKPTFAVTYQNISNRTLIQDLIGCDANPSLHWEISPASSVQEQFFSNNGLNCTPKTDSIKPNDVDTASGYGLGNGLYQMIKPGLLNVTLRMHFEDGSASGIQSTIQFNVIVQ
ncbi:MAG: hypothetical protein KGI28_01965 [Thaumarchaeota archaeon]|nr:hypothetical protein [Nitrososphaerota archaeon]